MIVDAPEEVCPEMQSVVLRHCSRVTACKLWRFPFTRDAIEPFQPPGPAGAFISLSVSVCCHGRSLQDSFIVELYFSSGVCDAER